MVICKRVAIIGGGFSGIGAIKALKEEGIEPVCFEKSPEVGGTWCYREEPVEGLPSTMYTTIINHSKEMGAISNYPFPPEAPNYLRHYELYELYKAMGEKLDLFKHVTCNREVVSVKRASDYEETGRWTVTVRNTENGELTTDVFDGVMVCTGHITYPNVAEYPGMEKFKGKIMHSHDLKRVHGFAGQHVAVVGTGCSAMDAAVEIANVARKVYLSMRTPSWLLPRTGLYGLPMDYVMLRRFVAFFQKILPLKWASWYFERNFIEPTFSHKLFGIRPKYPFLSRDPSINDGLPSKLITGAVVVRPNIDSFEEDGVIFEGEKEVTTVDAVILATGYTWKFPFLEEGVLQVEGDKICLYKCMYPPNLKHPTLAIIGFFLPIGPGFPIGELQTRWAVHLFSGKGTLPSREVMMQDVEKRYKENKARYSPSEKTSIRVDYIPFMDDLASQFGVKPNFWKMLFTDPKLFRACVFGPCLPYQYRLVGPHKWDGARDAILTAPHRVVAPLRGKRERRRRTRSLNVRTILSSYITTVLFIALLLYWRSTALRYYFLAAFLPYYVSVRSFSGKYYLALLLLPFFIPWPNFVSDYFTTVLVPFLLAVITYF